MPRYERDDVKKSASQDPGSPSELIDARIMELGDWRGETLSRVRTLIKQADPEVVEEWKWRGTPVWSHDGSFCTGETYKSEQSLGVYVADAAMLQSDRDAGGSVGGS